MQKDNQVLAVKRHLMNHGSITPNEAKEEYGIMRLSAIVFNLRHVDGWDIETQNVTVKNRFGNPTTYAKYVLKGAK